MRLFLESLCGLLGVWMIGGVYTDPPGTGTEGSPRGPQNKLSHLDPTLNVEVFEDFEFKGDFDVSPPSNEWEGMFDAVYLINLPGRADRRNFQREQLYNLNLLEHTLWVKPQKYDNVDESCWEAHRTACTHALSHNKTRILVLEDDAYFTPSVFWFDVLKSTLENLEYSERGWMRIMLGGVPFYLWPSGVDLPFRTWKGAVSSNYAAVLHVDTYCAALQDMPFTAKADQQLTFGLAWQSPGINTIPGFFIKLVRTIIIYGFVKEAPFRKRWKNGMKFLWSPAIIDDGGLDAWLSYSIVEGTYLILPLPAVQIETIYSKLNVDYDFHRNAELKAEPLFIFLQLIMVFVCYGFWLVPFLFYWGFRRRMSACRWPFGKLKL